MLKVIEIEDIKKEQLIEIERLENDVKLINDTMKLLNEIYSENRENIEVSSENIQSVKEEIIESNKQLIDSTKLQKSYISNKVALTGMGILVLGTPIGIVYGINTFVAATTLTLAGIWLTK